MHQIRVDDLKA